MAAATAAQAPVPQARVSPLPRSHTRIRRQVRFTTRTNSVFTRSGKIGAYSKAGPTAGTSRPSRPSIKTTQCGFPTDTQVMFHSCPPIIVGRLTTAGSSASTGTSAAFRLTRPMSAVTELTLPSRR